MAEFNEKLPQLQHQEVFNGDEGIKKGLDGFEAIHFVGGDGKDTQHLGPEGCEDLLLQWGDISTVLSVKIGPNSIDDVGVERLCQLLQKNDNLLYFQMYTNAISKAGGLAFATMLSINKTLVALRLVDSKIDDACFSVIAKELEVGNRSLLQLDVSNNHISNAGAKALAKALKVNDVITTISLAANDIAIEGGNTLETALATNYTLCDLFLEKNNLSDYQMTKIAELCDRNVMSIRQALEFCNQNVKEGPLRKAKFCFVGKNLSGKTSLIEALKGQGYVEHYQPTEGAAVTQVLTRLRGEMWYKVSTMPPAAFSYHFMSRFINIKLDENIEKMETEKPKEIGFAGLKKRGNRRGSIKQRRASVTGNRKIPNEKAVAADGRNSTARASRQTFGRRSSVAMSVLNAVLGEPGVRGRRNSVKELVKTVAHPFNRQVNDLLDDKDYVFYGEKERAPGEAKTVYDEKELGANFDTIVTAKARRERDNLAFNLLELSGDRIYYTIHHAFLTSQAVYVLLFNMEKIANKEEHMVRLEEIKYINYWLKVIKYHSPDAKLMVVGTHAGKVNRELYGNFESDISKLVFPELHKAHARRKEAMKLNKAVQAANEFAKDLEEEKDFVNKKAQLIVNEKDRRLFFPVEISTGKGVNNIRLALDEAAQKQEYYGKKIPVRWLKYLDALRKDAPSYFCPAKRVKALAFQILEDSENEMSEALQYFHEIGYIVYVTDVDELRDTVITDTLSFYRIMFKLIFTADLASFDLTEARNAVGDDVDETINTGLISNKFLDYLWSGEQPYLEHLSEKDAKSAKRFFLDYAQLNLIISEYNFAGEKKYIIPSMIPLNPDIVIATREKYGDGMNLRAKLRFGGNLTLGVFERLLCLCLQFSSKQEKSLPPIVAMGWGQISFGLSYVFRIVREPDDIIIHVIESKKKKKAYKLLQSFEQMLEKLRQILGKGLKWQLTVEDVDGEGEYIPYEQAKQKKVKGWFS